MGFKIESVDPKKTAVVVVDMQNDFVTEGFPLYTPMAAATIPKMSTFLDECREKGIYIVYTTHVHRANGDDFGIYNKLWDCVEKREGLICGTPGGEIAPGVAPKGDEIVIEKHRYSGFYNTDLDIVLRNRKIETTAIVGVATDVCCFSTARDAMFYGYDVAFISDLTGTFQFPNMGYGDYDVELQQKMTLNNIALTTGDVMTADEFVSKIK